MTWTLRFGAFQGQRRSSSCLGRWATMYLCLCSPCTYLRSDPVPSASCGTHAKAPRSACQSFFLFHPCPFNLPSSSAECKSAALVPQQPRIGGEVRPHQDSTFLYTEPPSVIGLWWALEDANKTNGCLWTLPGAHAQGVARRFLRTCTPSCIWSCLCQEALFETQAHHASSACRAIVLLFYQQSSAGVCRPDQKIIFDRDLPEYNKDEFVPLEVPSGALVLLHGANVHFSYENTSACSRHAYSMHVIEAGPGHAYPSNNWCAFALSDDMHVCHMSDLKKVLASLLRLH
jgi:hypothetical protein